MGLVFLIRMWYKWSHKVPNLAYGGGVVSRKVGAVLATIISCVGVTVGGVGVGGQTGILMAVAAIMIGLVAIAAFFPPQVHLPNLPTVVAANAQERVGCYDF